MTLQLVQKPAIQLTPSVFTQNVINRLASLNAAARRMRELGFEITNEELRMEKRRPLIELAVSPRDITSLRLLRLYAGVNCVVTEDGKPVAHGELYGVEICWEEVSQ